MHVQDFRLEITTIQFGCRVTIVPFLWTAAPLHTASFSLKGKSSECPQRDTSRLGGYSLQCSSFILSGNPSSPLLSCDSKALLAGWDARSAITEELQPPNLIAPSISVSDWIWSTGLLVLCFISFLFCFLFFFQVVSGYCTTGSVLWIASNIPSQSRALYIV